MRARNVAVLVLFAFGCGNSEPSRGARPSATAAGEGSAGSATPVAADPAPASASANASASAAPAPSASASAAPSADPKKLTIEGTPKQGGILHAKIDGHVKKIGFPGHKTTILDDGEFLIAFPRTAPQKEKLTLTLDDGSVIEREFEIEQRTYAEDRIDGLPKKMVDLDAETKKKVGIAEAKIDELRMHFGDGPCFKEKFVWPVKGKLSSRYGQQRFLNGSDAGPHWGVDIVAPLGTKVHAPACGKVVYEEKDVPLSGNVIVIDHGRGLTSTFLHLDKFKVKKGDTVKQGEEIGTVGLTGRTNGAHLDWRMNLFDIRTDPELLAPPMK